MIFLWKSCTKRDSKPLTKLRALAIAPRPSLYWDELEKEDTPISSNHYDLD